MMNPRIQVVAGRPGFPLLPALAATAVSTTVGMVATPYMGVATFAYLSMVGGVFARRHAQLHATLMATAMTLDVGLVLVLEATRHATRTAAGTGLNSFQMMHVIASVVAVLLYLPLAWLGLSAFKGQATASQRRTHGMIGVTAFIFRTVGFLLMFSMLSRVRG